jgi:hypothetical protein
MEHNMNENVRDLIDAIDSRNSEAIMSTFDTVMNQKIASAIEFRKQEISSSLFGGEMLEEVPEEETLESTPESEETESNE